MDEASIDPSEIEPGIAEPRESPPDGWQPGEPDPNNERVLNICEANGWPLGIKVPDPPDTIG